MSKLGKFAAACVAVLCAFGLQAAPERRVKMHVAGFTGYYELENFPLLVRISPERIEGFSYDDCAENGADISFTLPDGTLLAHEVDTWNPQGESVVWVSLPKFGQQASFYFRWKDAAPPAVDSTAVWTKAGYVGVWHLNEAGGDALDSSGNGYTATLCGAKADQCVTCESDLGRGRQMGSSGTGANSIYFKMATVPQSVMSATFAISLWVKTSTNSGDCWFSNKDAIADNGFSAVGNGFYNTAEFNVAGDGSSTTKILTRTSTLVTDVWTPFELNWDGTAVGVRCGTSGGGRTTAMTPTQDGFAIGSTMDGSVNALRGQADEIRLRTEIPTDNWRTIEEEQVRTENYVIADSAAEVIKAGVRVTSAAAEFSDGENPVYGEYEMTAGQSHAFTAPATVEAQDGAVTATCVGWTLSKVSDGSVVRTSESPAAGEDTTTCIVTYSEPMTLTWRWATVQNPGRAITYYVSPAGSGLDGLSWATAFTHPQDAIDAAAGTEESPATVLVAEGFYPARTVDHLHTALHVNKSYITVRSDKGPSVTFLDGTTGAADGRYAYRGLTVDENLTAVLVSGFGICGGYKNDDQFSGWDTATSLAAGSGILSNLQIVVANRDRCNPVYLKGTVTLVDSDVTTVAAPKTTGWFDRSNCYLMVITGSALVDRCVIHDVPAYKTGSDSLTKQLTVNPVFIDSANAILRNSRITGCVNGDAGYSMPNGATVYATAGTIENCTIASNKTYNAAGGLSIGGSVVCRNNVIWGNVTVGGAHKDIDIADGKTPSISFTCSSDVTTDVDGNVNGDPSFQADYSLPIDSLIVGKGDPSPDWLVGGAIDLAGNPRLWTDGTVTPGAFEPQGRATKVYVAFALTNAVDFGRAPFVAGFKPTVSGMSGEVTYAWDFGDGAVSSEIAPDHTYTAVGCYTVKLTVTEAGKDPVDVSQPGLVTVVGETCYARADQEGVKPYDTWEKATSNIEAIVALKPSNIVVTNGTYVISSIYGLTLDWPATVRSVEGPEKTILDTGCRKFAGSADQTTVRNLTLTHPAAVVDGFGLVKGKNTAIVTTGGTVRNCRFSQYLGAHKLISVSASDTTFEDCVFDFSHVSAHDGNVAHDACGLSLTGASLIDRCVISNYYCSVDRVQTDWLVSGGAVRLDGTSAIRNSYVTGNEYRLDKASTCAGVVVIGTSNEVANCTIVGNRNTNTGTETASCGGGLYVSGTDAQIFNNVIYDNQINGASHDVDFAAGATGLAFAGNLLANEAELPAGATGCVTGRDPLFADDGAGYHITKDSPCFNAGCKVGWASRKGMATDIDGQERRCGPIDIGCWELQRPLGLLLLVR